MEEEMKIKRRIGWMCFTLAVLVVLFFLTS